MGLEDAAHPTGVRNALPKTRGARTFRVNREVFRSEEIFGSVLLEPLFGAAKRVPADATAFAGREANYNATFINSWTDANIDERNVEIARGYAADLAPWSTGGGYMNYAS